jgi:hypothetical protein
MSKAAADFVLPSYSCPSLYRNCIDLRDLSSGEPASPGCQLDSLRLNGMGPPKHISRQSLNQLKGNTHVIGVTVERNEAVILNLIAKSLD